MKVCLSMSDLLLSPGTEGLREQNICETKNCEIKVCELDLENWKSCGIKDGVWAEFPRIYLFIYGLFTLGIKSHKIEHTFKMYD